MKIRTAEFEDYEQVKQFMIDFANANPFTELAEPEYNDLYANRLIDNFIKNGVALVADNGERVVGMLLALTQGDIWLPHVKTMREVAWWVDPEYRGSSAGAKLLKEYTRIGDAMVEHEMISAYTITTLGMGDNLKLQKRGWHPIETNFVRGVI
jgi:N-acetylglutamate synthase-like GNAT family acetyltransferase